MTMIKQLISARGELISPEDISDKLQMITNIMLESKLHTEQAVYLYNIFSGVYNLLKRYETCSRETLLAVAVEENEQKLREHLSYLHKNALYNKLYVPQIGIEKY